MIEYFINGTSFASPFVGEPLDSYIKAESPEDALYKFVAKHKTGLRVYAANAYASADDFHKNKKPLARWLCNKEIFVNEKTKGMKAYSIYSANSGHVRIDGENYQIVDPFGGQVVSD